jgi:iron(III) transport system substrate-binding protein
MRACILLIVVASAVMFGSCGKDTGKKKLVIYSPHGKEMLTEFEKSFEAANPDTDIQWLDMGSQEVYDRVRTEKANPLADIWWGAPATMFMRAEKEGFLEKY